MKRILLLLVISITLIGCQQDSEQDTELPNPASEYCIEQGGSLDIRDTEDGQVGICILPDGTECEEWAYMNDECPISSFDECVQAGNPVMESYPRQCEANGEVFVENLSFEERCENLYEGEWLDEHQECEGISENQCQELGGSFDDCASACRHDPDAEICTKQCVFVCEVGSGTNETESDNTSNAELCRENDGKWLDEYQECEGIPESACTANGGSFDGCASACRNDPDAEFCTMQCVPVCSW
ncbi:MAG: DUF333 domain-containing protein [Candidatus Woesearchaeota archaeon]